MTAGYADRNRDADPSSTRAAMNEYKAMQGATLRIVDGDNPPGFYQQKDKYHY